MDNVKMLTYRKGTVLQRQIKITTGGEDTLVIDFCEQDGRTFYSKYYMIVNNADMTTVKMLGAMTAWLEKDDDNFKHPELMISEEDM